MIVAFNPPLINLRDTEEAFPKAFCYLLRRAGCVPDPTTCDARQGTQPLAQALPSRSD
jgi:hypothetical protein